MRVFNCSHCGHLVFFDSVQCLHCGSVLAFLPDQLTLAALEPAPGDADPGLWRARADCCGAAPVDTQRLYRMCHNHTEYEACNFAVPAHEDAHLCASCRQTRVLPDLSYPGNLRRWKQIEAAKRQLFYTLARLGLEPSPGGSGPVFEFLADLPGGPPVMTGHLGGTITLNTSQVAAGQGGTITISHDGRYAALDGKAVSVEPATGFTFDTPLLPRPSSTKMVPRDS